jgi:hypothetical protein
MLKGSLHCDISSHALNVEGKGELMMMIYKIVGASHALLPHA